MTTNIFMEWILSPIKAISKNNNEDLVTRLEALESWKNETEAVWPTPDENEEL